MPFIDISRLHFKVVNSSIKKKHYIIIRVNFAYHVTI